MLMSAHAGCGFVWPPTADPPMIRTRRFPGRLANPESGMYTISARRLQAVIATLSIGIWTVTSAAAEQYPSQPVRIVVGDPAGGPLDIATRIVATKLAETEKWSVIVENKPGAMSTIGATDVLRQPADGHTILSAGLPAAVAPALMQNVDFRFEAEFVPVARLITGYHVLVVHPSMPAHSLVELVALLKAQPGKFSFSSGGSGTPAHLAGELFKQQAGVHTTHAPHRALPQAITDLVRGTVHYQFISPLPVLDLVVSGKLRAIAVTAPQRIPALPHVPTVVEQGFPDLVMQDWIGLFVRRGTPDTIVTKLNEATNDVLASPAVRHAFAKAAATPAPTSSAAFDAFIKAQVVRWDRVVKQAGIKVQ
jgi:tripartite-type tricarboxylate transporter receptor subunit TctC